MPKSLVRDPDKPIRTLLFGDDLKKVDIKELHRRTGIPESTLRLYRKNPSMMNLYRFGQIIKAMDLEDGEVMDAIHEAF